MVGEQRALFEEGEASAGRISQPPGARAPTAVTKREPACSHGPWDGAPSAAPVLISACLLGLPCRWHGRRAKRREELLARLKQRYMLVPVCPEQLGGMPTPRTSEMLKGATGADVLEGRARLIAPETHEDVTHFHVAGARYTLELAQIVGARRAYLKGGSPSCDREGVTGELLRRAGIEVVRVP